MMAGSSTTGLRDNGVTGQRGCRDCGMMFPSGYCGNDDAAGSCAEHDLLKLLLEDDSADKLEKAVKEKAKAKAKADIWIADKKIDEITRRKVAKEMTEEMLEALVE